MKPILALIALLLVGPASAQNLFTADSGLSIKSFLSVNNTTAIPITTVLTRVYSIEGFTSAATPAFLKLYNGVATCGQASPLPIARYAIPANTAPPLITNNENGDAYSNGVTACLTGALADTDTTAPAAGTFAINIHFKAIQQAQ